MLSEVVFLRTMWSSFRQLRFHEQLTVGFGTLDVSREEFPYPKGGDTREVIRADGTVTTGGNQLKKLLERGK